MSGILADAIAQELGFLRSEAEALFTDDFQLRRYADGWEYDAAAKQNVRIHEVLYVARGKLVTSTAPTTAEAGARTVASIDRTLHLSVDTDPVRVGDAAVRLSDGAEFRVLADVTHAHPKTRRLQVEEVLS